MPLTAKLWCIYAGTLNITKRRACWYKMKPMSKSSKVSRCLKTALVPPRSTSRRNVTRRCGLHCHASVETVAVKWVRNALSVLPMMGGNALPHGLCTQGAVVTHSCTSS